MRSSELIREIERAGWVKDRVRGSHYIFRHPERPDLLVIPHHAKKDLGKGLVEKIRKLAGI